MKNHHKHYIPPGTNSSTFRMNNHNNKIKVKLKQHI